MAWYVFALVDAVSSARPGPGLQGPLTARRVPGGYVIIERRADVPPMDFGTLKKHDAIVTRLAAASPAILPVRFGTLLEMDDMEEALADRDEEIAEAFAAVRDRVQFTWRAGGARGARGAQGARGARGARGGAAGAAGALSGTEYLRQAAARSVPPAAFRNVRTRLRSLVAAERYQPSTVSLPDALYHLVDRGSIERYRLIAGKVASSAPALRVTGPFPPFAFTPELL